MSCHAVKTNRALIDSGDHRLTMSLRSEAVCMKADATRPAQAHTILIDKAAKLGAPGRRLLVAMQRQGHELQFGVTALRHRSTVAPLGHGVGHTSSHVAACF